MKTLDHTSGMDPQEKADDEAVMRYFFEGKPLDPEVAKRVHDQAAKVTEEIRLVHGLVDDATFQALQALLDDEDA